MPNTYTVTMYDAEDCEALKYMSKEEVADVLENLEGNWMPSRPSGYYADAQLNESEYHLLRYCIALDLATKYLREGK